MTEPAPGPQSPAAVTPGPYRRARRRLGRLRRSLADPDNLSARLRKQRAQLEQQATQIAQLKSTVATLGKRMHPIELASNHRQLEHGRLAIQVGICEERLGKIEEQLRDEQFAGEESEHAEARGLVDAVRREHEQIRVRMQIIGQYEERLRRMEDTVVMLYEGDKRHPF
jgi:hypothetical protein